MRCKCGNNAEERGKMRFYDGAATKEATIYDTQGFIEMLQEMIGEFFCTKGYAPEALYMPDNEWFWIEMLEAERFGELSEEKKKEIIAKKSNQREIKLLGLQVYGTIRVPHLR